jgi:hypothetical protein
MAGPVSNYELDSLIWRDLRDRDGCPTNSSVLVAAAGGKWRRIVSRIEAMSKAGRIRFHLVSAKYRPSHVRAHGWEVLGCPGAGIQEDGQFDWAYGCADCQRRLRPNPADGVTKPPGVVFDECELRIEPSA